MCASAVMHNQVQMRRLLAHTGSGSGFSSGPSVSELNIYDTIANKFVQLAGYPDGPFPGPRDGFGFTTKQSSSTGPLYLFGGAGSRCCDTGPFCDGCVVTCLTCSMVGRQTRPRAAPTFRRGLTPPRRIVIFMRLQTVVKTAAFLQIMLDSERIRHAVFAAEELSHSLRLVTYGV